MHFACCANKGGGGGGRARPQPGDTEKRNRQLYPCSRANRQHWAKNPPAAPMPIRCPYRERSISLPNTTLARICKESLVVILTFKCTLYCRPERHNIFHSCGRKFKDISCINIDTERSLHFKSVAVGTQKIPRARYHQVRRGSYQYPLGRLCDNIVPHTIRKAVDYIQGPTSIHCC